MECKCVWLFFPRNAAENHAGPPQTAWKLSSHYHECNLAGTYFYFWVIETFWEWSKSALNSSKLPWPAKCWTLVPPIYGYGIGLLAPTVSCTIYIKCYYFFSVSSWKLHLFWISSFLFLFPFPFFPFFFAVDNMTGLQSLYTIYEGHEIMFHVSTLLPFTPDNPQQVSNSLEFS